jgi:predicted nucleic acid-binding protein
MRYLLDTNILSNVTKPEPSRRRFSTRCRDEENNDANVAAVAVVEA